MCPAGSAGGFEAGRDPAVPLRAFLEDQGFNSLLARLNNGSAPSGRAPNMMPAVRTAPMPQDKPLTLDLPAIDRGLYETVTDIGALDRWIAEARAEGVMAVDTETDALDAIVANLVGISLSTGPGKACYVPLVHGGTDMFAERPAQIEAAVALAALKPLLETTAC
jgi:DNA polymerase-1